MRLQLDTGVRRYGDGRVLLGGAPVRLLRLGVTGARLLDDWIAGTPVADETAPRSFARRLLDAGIVHPAAEPGAATNSLVTLIVPVRDNQEGLARLLASTIGIEHRIVVDDGSGAPLPNATVRHRCPRGPAAARNSGRKCATTPLLAFLDSDVLPDPGWLDHLLPLFDDPAVAAVAPRVRSLATGPVGPYEMLRSALDMGAEPASVRPDGRVRYVPGAALIVRADALEVVGGFDETLRYGEDVDLVWRLVTAGYSVRYQPLSTVRHEPRDSFRAFLRQRFGYGTSAAALARRHPNLLHATRLPAPSAGNFVLALLAALPAVVTLDRARLGPGTLARYTIGVAGFAVAVALPATSPSLRTVRSLRDRNVPLHDAVVVAATGRLALVRQLADTVRRVWWPFALCSRRGRALLGLAWAAAAIECMSENSSVAVRFADEVAYGLGVWTGCLGHRCLTPLLPRFHRILEEPTL
ncbi:mycofactocin biosynthesis glycosyltransferase MftF [Nocardia sp. NPDC006630]|uniref:mycofactocin biosynthesis glycosyltransferase MftF n=1 Tax=Nocardia sp. NPDC006630 TaxID=3157181 RepID=UPI0033B5FB32